MKINTSKFTIVSNGYADGPSQALRDYLIDKDADALTTITHPLVPNGDNAHIISVYKNKKRTIHKRIRLIHRPPLTYLLDMFVPTRILSDSVWFGFNNLACLRGLIRRKFRKTHVVVYWAVDFVPMRFGNNVATKVYNMVDRFVCMHADFRVELTQEGLAARTEYLKLNSSTAAPAIVIPMGSWLRRTPKASIDNFHKKQVVYMGHIVERQGVSNIIKAMKIIVSHDPDIMLDVVGGGPDEPRMRQLADDLGLAKNIKFRGFIKDHKDVEKYLSNATVAVAPYVKTPDNFTATSDPGKIKAYLGASLPIVLTDVPPIAKLLSQRGVALICEDTPESIAIEVMRYISNESLWIKAHESSENMAKDYDWDTILKTKLKSMNIG